MQVMCKLICRGASVFINALRQDNKSRAYDWGCNVRMRVHRTPVDILLLCVSVSVSEMHEKQDALADTLNIFSYNYFLNTAALYQFLRVLYTSM